MPVQQGAGLVRPGLAPAEQRRAVGAHEARDIGPDDLHAHLLLKGPQHRLVVEGAALDHDVPPQLLGGGGPDDLVDGVLHHGDGEAGGDVLDGGPVLLGLLDRGVHEHRAPAAQVYGPLGKEAQLGEFLHVIAQRLGEGLQKAAAAGGAGLVQENVADGPVLDLETLHVLAADVDDEVHIGQEVAGGGEVGHRLHHAVVGVEGVFRQILAVAGGGDRRHVQRRMLVIQLLEHLPDQGHRIAQIGLVVGEEDPGVLVDDHHLHGGGAGVDADVDRGGVVRAEGHPGHRGLGVPGPEGLVLPLAVEQGRLGPVGLRRAVLLQVVRHLLEVKGLVGVKGRAQGHEQQAVLRAGALHAQGVVKALPQAAGEGQGPAQVQHVPLDGPALGQAGDGLVHHRLIDAGGDVLRLGSLVDQGLDVALGEHAAAGGDGVCLFRLLGGGVHLIGAHFQQRCHLVDEGAGAAGAGAVHPHLHAAGEEQDLGVLAAQLDDAVRPRGQAARRHPGGEHLLDKGDAHALRHAHAGGAGDGQVGRLAVLVRHPAQQLLRLLQNMAVMPLVCTVYQILRVVQHHAFDGGGTYVKSNFQLCFLLTGKRLRQQFSTANRMIPH